MEFDELSGFQIDIKQFHISPGKGVGNVCIGPYSIPGLFVSLFCRGIFTPDADHVRHILAHTLQAQPPGGVGVFELGSLKLPLVSCRVRNILKEDEGLFHFKGSLIVLHKMRRRFRIEDLGIRQADHAFRRFLVGVPGKSLVAGQIDPCPGILGEGHSRHIV